MLKQDDSQALYLTSVKVESSKGREGSLNIRIDFYFALACPHSGLEKVQALALSPGSLSIDSYPSTKVPDCHASHASTEWLEGGLGKVQFAAPTKTSLLILSDTSLIVHTSLKPSLWSSLRASYELLTRHGSLTGNDSLQHHTSTVRTEPSTPYH